MFLRLSSFVLLCTLLFSCRELLKTTPEHISDTSDIVITCDSRMGNKGLLDYTGDVYVHVGLITSKSRNGDDWRYVKFTWGSRETEARATQAGKNRWAYTIPNIRKFFNVHKDEKIIKLAILYRSGACIDVYCKVLRNVDGSNMYIPIDDQSSKEKHGESIPTD
ncbi:MAG: hypothetical protein C0490_14870 [Marivirga sp.]|nr:hypothetical protein [Marivirga sp.]